MGIVFDRLPKRFTALVLIATAFVASCEASPGAGGWN